MAKGDAQKMPEWRTKKVLLKLRRSGTPGKEKGLNCQATGLDKAMAQYPRSYKNDNKKLWAAWDLKCKAFWKNN